MSERFSVLQLVHRLHRGTWDYEPPTWAASLHNLAEVAEAVERLEAENQDLKRRLEVLEKAANATQQCPDCGGTGRQIIGTTERGHITAGCPACDGTGRGQGHE